jgi:23S rRNA pseudouridine955/2504/2580 synthase
MENIKKEIKEIKVTVESGYGGIELEKFLKKQKLGIAFGLMQKLLRKKAIRINGKRAKAETIINDGDLISIPAESRGKIEKPKYVGTEQDLQRYIIKNIIYEDENIIAINKPQGLATQGGSGITMNVDALLPLLAKKKGGKYFLVHRIDKDTTGALIIAKNVQAARLMGDSFKHRYIEKKYLALVVGKVFPMEGYISYKLGKRQSSGTIEKIVVDEEHGKKAYTEYKVLRHYSHTASLLEVTPETGRKHQIRVHLAAIGHPIIGDGKYGGTKTFVEGISKNMRLHSWKMSHKENYFKGTITADMPKDFDLDSLI